MGTVAGRRQMIIANDATVKAGAFFPATTKKVLRAQRIAFQNRLPLIYLVDSAGVFLPLQEDVFPDEDDFGRIFRNNAVMSAAGLGQIAAIMGNCVAGGGYLPVLCDKLLMTDGSGLYLAGPALVKSAIGQEVSSEELGGAEMHARVSGTIDYRDPNDEACLERLRRLVSALRRRTADAGPVFAARTSPAAAARQRLYDLVGNNPRHEYDVRQVLDCIVDQGTFDEFKPEYGQTLVCGTARLGGFAVGIVASQHHQVRPADGPIQFGGVLYVDSAEKAARFVMTCNQDWLPIVFLQDVNGFMVGRDSERDGIIKAGAKLVNAISNSRVPKLTVILGGSFGAGNYALCGKAFDPRLIFAWPTALCRDGGRAGHEHPAGRDDQEPGAAGARGRRRRNGGIARYKIKGGLRPAWMSATERPGVGSIGSSTPQTREELIYALELSTRHVQRRTVPPGRVSGLKK